MSPPDGLHDVDKRLAEAAVKLGNAADDAGKRPANDLWSERADDLRLLMDQVVDIRQQLATLKLEVPEPPVTSEVSDA